MSIKDENNNKNLATYLPYSEHCLAPKFLATQSAVSTFVRLMQESHDTRPIAAIIAEMPGLTEEQKNKAITVAEELKKRPTRKKLDCQF